MIKIYLCGPTVYDSPHIGNMRPIIIFDIYRRALISLNKKVKFVHNITDIDDKIIAQAIKEKTTEKQIAKKYEKEYIFLLNHLNILKPDSLPRVTDNINLIIEFIDILIKKQKAYLKNGNVFFDIQKFLNYGIVSNQKIQNMYFKTNISKINLGDFALWKKTTKGILFDSPWGKGRPGWHTECFVFIQKEFQNQQIDIHGGGIDLIFPHHENENAQYEALNKKPITKNWKHIGVVKWKNEKMSKSKQNTWKAKSFLEQIGSDELRYIFFSASVTKTININNLIIQESQNKILNYKKIFNNSQLYASWNSKYILKKLLNYLQKFEFAKANKFINEKVKEYKKNPNELNAKKIINIFKLIGFNFSKNIIDLKYKNFYFEWLKLKENKNFKKADELRLILQKQNII